MLISSDLDMLQCIGPLTHMYALKKGLTNIELFDPASFEEKYGISTDQFLDLKSLKGDGSDNIPGVPVIGEKTAVQLLQQYKTLDGVYENLALIKDSTAKKLEAGRESAYMSKKVAVLFDDAPVNLDLDQMDVRKLDNHRLADLLKKLEFRSLLRNLPESMQNGTMTAESDQQNSSVDLFAIKQPEILNISSDSELSKITPLDGDCVLFARCAGKHGKQPTVLIVANKDKGYAVDLKKVTHSKVVNFNFQKQ